MRTILTSIVILTGVLCDATAYGQWYKSEEHPSTTYRNTHTGSARTAAGDVSTTINVEPFSSIRVRHGISIYVTQDTAQGPISVTTSANYGEYVRVYVDQGTLNVCMDADEHADDGGVTTVNITAGKLNSIYADTKSSVIIGSQIKSPELTVTLKDNSSLSDMYDAAIGTMTVDAVNKSKFESSGKLTGDILVVRADSKSNVNLDKVDVGACTFKAENNSKVSLPHLDCKDMAVSASGKSKGDFKLTAENIDATASEGAKLTFSGKCNKIRKIEESDGLITDKKLQTATE